MKIEISNDKTTKFVFSAGYSTVLIPLANNRKSLCLSSQIGCAMNCQFCLSAKTNFKKNLNFEELIEQLEIVLKHLNVENLITKNNSKGSSQLSEHINSIVFMGMGEPLLNLDNVLKFCEHLNEFYGYSYKKISISTSGIIPKMYDVINYKDKVQLALSLHSPDQKIRDKIMPGLKGFKIEELVKVCNNYNKHYRQKIMIEYLMIDGLTDREEDLQKLIDFKFMKYTNFNLIPLNSTFTLDGVEYSCSKPEKIEYFKKKLMEADYKCFTRTSMGTDIEAACGMLK